MYTFKRLSGYGAIFVHIVTGIIAYHFDVDNLISYQDEARSKENRSSYFGYSVALWYTSSNGSWILIGAPRANSTSYKQFTEPGTVFKCEIGGSCQEWVLTHNTERSLHSGSWVGASMNIGRNKDGDIVLVCAPRWVNLHDDGGWWTMSGICYQASPSDFSRPNGPVGEDLLPLNNTEPYKEHEFYYAMGQAGFSTHIIPNTKSLEYILGCPGAYLSRGTPIFYIKETNHFNTANVWEEDTVDDGSYSGYAVTTGCYFRAGIREYATGAPRADNLRGTVIIFARPKPMIDNWTIRKDVSVNGDQIGAYFGSALASCDINGDGKDDLLVGAPQWSKNSDEGRIYIFKSESNTTGFDNEHQIDGETLRGRFGSTITCLGDIDYDGFDDIAVGAPYDGNGAVYIYHGGKDGIRFTQKIPAPEHNKGFGISISIPRDIDENGYGDIAVGAHLSGHVTVFRSKRVVNMNVMLSDLSEGPLKYKPEPFSVSICSSYSGRYAPEELNVTMELKLDEKHHRAEFDLDAGHEGVYKFNDTLKKFNTSCRNVRIIIKEMNKDFIHPITISAVQRLNTINKNGMLLINGNKADKNEYLYDFSAVMSKGHQAVQRHLDVLFASYCGKDKICNSNLSINMMTDLEDNNRYLIGSTPYIKLNIEVTNTGEHAYGSMAVIVMPEFIGLHAIPSTCSTKVGKHYSIICDIGNPLGSNDTKNVTLELDMSRVTSNIEQFYLNATALSRTSNDTVSGDHKTSLSINCAVETDIGILGKANNDSYSYAWKKEKEVLPPIMFQHIYEIRNYEVTPIAEAQLSVSIPTHLIHGGKEIEIVKVIETTGNLDKREFSCMDPEEDDALAMIDRSISDNSSSRFVPQAEKNLTTIGGKTFDASLDNRTLHINCSNPSFKWKTIDCKFGPFKTGMSVARLVFTFDLLLPNFTSEMMQKKDIILFVTNASTRVTMPLGTTQTVNIKPDSILIGTMFLGSTPRYQLPSMLIPLSVSAGLLLFIFIVLGLLKLGFFKRSKKMELEALKKEENNICPRVVLETTSSVEALDQS